ncbi:hypothetical protein D3C84_993160 [compost metagenome]
MSSSAADASCVADPEIRCKVSRSFSCMVDIARSRRPASSLPSTAIGRVRLPLAISSAASSALAIGLVMLLVSSQANSRVRPVAMISSATTQLKAVEYCCAAP